MNKHFLIGLIAATILIPFAAFADVLNGDVSSSNSGGGSYVGPGSVYPVGPADVPPAYYRDTPVSPDSVMCTRDAMQCPDGTWVGRSGPNCEFVCGATPTPPVGIPPYGGYVDGSSGGYIDWEPMWWNPLAEGSSEQPPYWGGAIPPDGTICTQDAMQCPDGTWVGRSGPNCEFVCGYEEAPYPGVPGNSGGYIDWTPMWWNPLAESAIAEEPYRNYEEAPYPGMPGNSGGFWGMGDFFKNIFSWWGF